MPRRRTRLLRDSRPGRSFLRRLWSSWSMERAVRMLRTPRRLDDYMQVCFEYVQDHKEFSMRDYWKPPRLTFATRRGDCEDYALFARHVLKHHGYQPRIFTAFVEDDGHAVCVFRDGRAWNYIDNEGVSLIRGHDEDGHPARAEQSVALARLTAEHVYPGSWTMCSWVDRYQAGDPDAGDHEPLLPSYEWIYPEGVLPPPSA